MNIPKIEFPIEQSEIAQKHKMLCEAMRERNEEIRILRALDGALKSFCAHPGMSPVCTSCGVQLDDDDH
jgi:hypothetical protein